MSLIFNGAKVEVPGLKTISFLDDPRIAPQITDRNERKRRVRAIILHTTSGTCSAGKVKPGKLTSDDKSAVLARYQTRSERSVSWDYTIGRDAVVLCQNDPMKHYSWHATSWNSISVGIELVQDTDGTLYAEQLAAMVLLVDELTRRLRIQRQIAWRNDAPVLELLHRADEHAGRGEDMVGVFAHCNNTKSRGAGDPGPAPFRALKAAGYEGYDFAANAEDLKTWVARQKAFGIALQDGLPLSATCEALEAKGYKHGLIVSRPGD